ncbi:DegV family protein [Mycoplasmopsis felifaucium]|uniref:DegV family protein n=1 Tax=Mycoplasmopsis felifaucium TaxID=35768 RepID=A0ABZ2RP83_9BACT
MKKIGFIFDSFACEPKSFMDENGYGYLPFSSNLDGSIYLDGIDLEQKELLNKIKSSKVCKSSMPNPALIEEVFAKMSTEYDDVVYLPISSCLSSTYSTSKIIAQNFKNIHVLDNTWGAQQLLNVAKFAKYFYDNNNGDFAKLEKKLKEIQAKSLLFVLPQDVIHIINGGRVGSFKKFALKTLRLLKLKPYVKFYNLEAHTGGMARTTKGAASQIYNKLLEHLHIKNPASQISEYTFDIAHGIDDSFNAMLIDLAKEMDIKISSLKYLSSGVAIHTGYDVAAISIMPNLENYK